MKKFLQLFLFVALLGLIAYQFNFTKTPCAEQIVYNLGNFDTQFDISQEYFLSALREAEAVWEEPYGKELFSYNKEDSGTDVLKINLIYDYRQQATSKLASLGITVKDSRESYDSLKAKFTALKIEYEKDVKDFNTQIEAFNERQLAYEKEVTFWNKKGGAPEKEYNQLESERSALEVLSRDLKNKENKINEMADEINALVVVLNRLVSSLNLSVEKYNTINESRGESFEEGVYIQEGGKRQIDIYEFSDREKLVRVLAHELGHALGLDHVEDEKAIMYRLNQGDSIELSAIDLDALRAICGAE